MSESTGTTNLEPVLISPVVGGKIRTWSEDETRLWSVDDPAALGAPVGTRSRSPYDPAGQQVPRGCVSGYPDPGPHCAAALRFPGQHCTCRTVQAHRGIGPDGRRLGRSRVDPRVGRDLSAAGRGEFWLAELGGWDSPHEPNCLFTTVDESGLANAVMEATPAPVGTGVWAGGSERTNRRFRFGTSLTGTPSRLPESSRCQPSRPGASHRGTSTSLSANWSISA